MATSAELELEQVKQRIEEVTPAEARDELAAGGVELIDVREPHEHQEAHLEGDVLIPQGTLAERIEEVAPDTDQRVLLYCRSGNRSALSALELASKLGYENVASVSAGSSSGRSRAFRWSSPRGSIASSGCATRATRCCPRSASRAR